MPKDSTEPAVSNLSAGLRSLLTSGARPIKPGKRDTGSLLRHPPGRQSG
jgi:hypothetical protein